MNLISQANQCFSQDFTNRPDKVALNKFFADLSDADLIEFSNCLADRGDKLRPKQRDLFAGYVLKETTKRALSA